MSRVFNWVHLSDIHYNFENYQTEKMRDELITYLKKLGQETSFDVVLVTGDITYQGGTYKAELCTFLQSILESLNLKKNELCIIPGNHDIKRSEHRETLIKGILSSDETYEKIDKLNGKTYRDLMEGQKSFNSFYKKFFGEEYPKTLHSVKSFNLFNIVYIDTCFLSGMDNEEGSLIIGQQKFYNVVKALRESDEEKVNIAIAHHTLDCLDDKEQLLLENNLNDCNIDILLCGHMHKPKYSFRSDNTRTIPMFTCGAGITDKFAEPCVLTGCVDLDQKLGEVKYHSWQNESQYWHIDNTIGRRVINGNLEFKLERFSKDSDEQICEAINEDEFKNFIINFHSYIQKPLEPKLDFEEKDVQSKFLNMKCLESTKTQYDKFNVFFPIIDEIMDSSSYIDFQKKLIIMGVIVEEYNSCFEKCATGTEIIDKMVESIGAIYKDKVPYSGKCTEFYIRTLIYWVIYGCDIFNDMKV